MRNSRLDMHLYNMDHSQALGNHGWIDELRLGRINTYTSASYDILQ